MKIYGDLLTDKEKGIVYDTFEQIGQRRESLMQLLATLRVRESRLFEDINAIRSGEEMLPRHVIAHVEPTGNQNENGKETTRVISISQEKETRRDALERFEKALTAIQAEIRRTEDSLRALTESEAKTAKKSEPVPKIFDVLNELQNNSK